MRAICTVVGLDKCTDDIFGAVVGVIQRLAKVPQNRHKLLRELSNAASTLGIKTAAELRGTHRLLLDRSDADEDDTNLRVKISKEHEQKLLRILKTAKKLSPECGDAFAAFCSNLDLSDVWSELNNCLSELSSKELATAKGGDDMAIGEDDNNDNDDDNDDDSFSGQEDQEEDDEQEQPSTPRNRSISELSATIKVGVSSAPVRGILFRFIPMIEAFFIVNASDASTDSACETFCQDNQELLNALVRRNVSLLSGSLSPLVKHPKCRQILHFHNKRAYFKKSMTSLRNKTRRSRGSIRLSIRRTYIFEDSFHQLNIRAGDELRGKLSIAFQGEEGIDAGGVTREWYQILAREIFKPGYALFTPSADGMAFQPNPTSHIVRDHLNYFRFCGRIIGKAIADGQLLDAHFTRSFYKHILGVAVSTKDMESIDLQYYKSLCELLKHPVEVLCLDLTFSALQEEFGVYKTVDFIPNGRNIAVTDDSKEEYVRLATQHRMTDGIKKQTEAFLQGFYELVPKELVSIFNSRSLSCLLVVCRSRFG